MKNLTEKEIDLLKFNLQQVHEFDLEAVDREVGQYYDSLDNWADIYGHVSSLQEWKHKEYDYPDIHYHHRALVNTCQQLKIKSVCEVGAGAGVVAKYVYAATGAELTCLEGSSHHISQMQENFQSKSLVLKPYIDVPAKIVQGSIQKNQIEDNSFDMVYTCTVMMHMPYLVVPRAVQEIARISKKYILHVENKNDVINCVHIPGRSISSLNKLCIDYKGMYESMGIKTLKYLEYQPPADDRRYNYVFYLGEKIS